MVPGVENGRALFCVWGVPENMGAGGMVGPALWGGRAMENG